MSNSSLIDYTKISPNKTHPREMAIDTIAIHCVVGQLSVEALGNVFANEKYKASSNYGISPDGKVGLYVSEGDRSWCTSSRAVDRRAVTIECASDTTSPYAVKDACYNKLIILVADICKRNGIRKLVWSDSKYNRVNRINGCNMMVHRDWDSDKSCPGDFLYSRMGAIADSVNSILNGGTFDVAEPVNKEMCEVDVRVIGEGDSGNDVFAFQSYIKHRGFDPGTIDGDFGPKTKAAALKWQKSVGLVDDAIIGQKSWSKVLSE